MRLPIPSLDKQPVKTFLVALKTLIYMTGFVLFWGWIALSVRSFDRSVGFRLAAWSAWVVIVVAVAGAILALICAGVFVIRGRGTPAPFDPPEEFVALGPYKYVRNPMYVGGLALLIGFGLYLRSVSILILAVGLFLLVHSFVVFFEEPQLQKRFGATYEKYRQDVPRWIPGAPPAKRTQ